MTTFFLLTYRYFFYPIFHGLFRILGLFSEKIALGFQLRKSKPWLQGPSGLRPIWFHCASGEFEYAKPIIRQLKGKSPEAKILVTYFSPSVHKALEKNPHIDVFTPLPWDRPKDVQAFLKHFEPRCLAIARTDLWPELLHQVKKNKIPSLLFSKTTNGGKNAFQNLWNQFCLSYITTLFVVSEEDRRLLTPNIPANKIQVTGDSRYDQCVFRLANPTWTQPRPEALSSSEKPVVLFASTWPADHNVIIPAIKDLFQQFQFILVPHEPTAAHLKDLKKRLQGVGLDSTLLSAREASATDTVRIVDRVGILADLYTWCDFAYVGGSFDRGVHSVMEALAHGKPCFVGPKNRNNREVQEFKVKALQDGLFPVIEVKDTQQLCQALCKFKALWSPLHEQQLQGIFQQNLGSSPKVIQWIQENSR